MQSHVYAEDANTERTSTDSDTAGADSRDSERPTVNLDEMLPDEVSESNGVDSPPTRSAREDTDIEDETYECLSCESESQIFRPHCPECGGTKFKRHTPSRDTETPVSSKVVSRCADVTARFNPYIPR